MAREHASLLMIVPSEQEGMVLMEAEEKSGMIDDLDFIPPQYQASMKPLLYPIEDYIADLMILPGYQVNKDTLGVYRNDGVTHIALLSLAHEGKSMMFGAADFTLGFIVYYCAAHGKYRLLHCANCASAITGWLADMQKEWELNAGRGFQKARSTYH